MSSFAEHKSSNQPTRFNRLHFVFLSIWLASAGIFLYQFGLLFFLGFPFYFFFALIVIVWLSSGLTYFGISEAQWNWKKVLIYILFVLLLIPFATITHISYLNRSAEWAIRDFVTSVGQGEIPERFIINDVEGLNCFAEDGRLITGWGVIFSLGFMIGGLNLRTVLNTISPQSGKEFSYGMLTYIVHMERARGRRVVCKNANKIVSLLMSALSSKNRLT
jgi:hypothetical protein